MPIKFSSEAHFFRFEVLYEPESARRTCAQDFYVLKKSIDLSGVWTRESWITRRSRYPETTEADQLVSKLEPIYLKVSTFSWEWLPIKIYLFVTMPRRIRWKVILNIRRYSLADSENPKKKWSLAPLNLVIIVGCCTFPCLVIGKLISA